MIFSLRGARLASLGCLRNPLVAVRSLFVLLSLASAATLAGAQLRVGQPIDFGSTAVGTPISTTVVFSAATTTTVTSASVFTDGATGQDFTLGSDSCTGTIQQNATCSVVITFVPKRVGVRHGVLLLYNGTAQLNQVFLHGIGSGGAFAFAPANVTSLNTAPALIPSTFTAGAAVEDGNGNFFFTDVQNGRILEQNAAGTISFVATLPVRSTSGIAIGADGTLYVSALSSVWAFLPGAVPTPLLTGTTTLITPTGLGMDALGNLYIADSSTGQLSTYSLETSTTAAVPIVGLTPALSSPQGVAIGPAGNIYVADSGNDRVVEIAVGSGRSTVLTLTGLTLSNPVGLTLDPAGTVYVADSGNSRIVEITVNGIDFALTDPNLTLKTPAGVLMKPTGDLLVADTTYGLVLVPRSIPSVNFPTPTVVGKLDTTDGAITLALQAIGNNVAQLVFPNSGTEPTISTNAFALTNAGTCPSVNQGNPYTPLQFAIGDICTYTLTFTPLVDGLNKATFEVDISLPGGSPIYTTTVPLTGIGLSSVASFSFVASPSSTTVGAPVSLTLTALNAANGPATDYVGTVTFTSTDATSTFPSGTTFTFTAANQGVLTLPKGIDFNHIGTFTVHVTDGTFSANSNPVTVLDASAVTSFTSSVNPSLPGQTTTLLATVGSVTPGGAVPTGMVSFYNAGVLIGTATLVNGVAQINTSFAAPGNYPLTAVYSGDMNTATSTSGTLNQVVVNVTTVTSFTSSVNPSLVGQNTILTLNLAGSATLTGTVKFYDGATLIGTGTVSGNSASVTVSFATVGTHPLTAVYSGDPTDATTSATLNQFVVAPVAIAITSSVNPSLVGQQTIFTVSVTSANVAPTGTVKLYDGTTLLGTLTLVNGVATLPASFLTVGIHNITAVYSGDANNAAATSAIYKQDVVTATLATAFTSSVNPSQIGQNTVLSVTLAGTTLAPTGTVNFYDGTTLIGTGTIVAGSATSGVATITVSFATAGTHPLTAVYSGDNNNATVTTGPLNQIVLTAGTLVLTSSVNPSLVNQSVTLSAFLGTTTATGTIKFYDGTTLLGTSTVSAASATLAVTFTTIGIHTLTAVYSGDTSNAAITSANYAQDVVNALTTGNATLTSSVNPSAVNQSTTFALKLTATGATPTGTVKFFSNGILLGAATLVNGVASLPASFAATGTYPITAVYSGDTNYATFTVGPLNQIVTSTSTVILTSSINPSLVNQNTTLTAFLGSTTAGGMVKFYNGTTLMGTGNVSNGVASINISFPTAGIQTLTAVYTGDASNPAASSANYLQDVVTSTTVASFTSSVNPSVVGQSTILTATFRGTAVTPTGLVNFYDGTTLIGTGMLVNGVATITASFATPGTHPLTAVYAGDTSNATATAGPLNQIVSATPTGVTLTSSVNPVLVGASTTLTATLNVTTAVGSVAFYDGTTLLGTGNVAGNVASLPVSFATPGIHTLTAVYSGDTNHPTGTSANYAQTVLAPATITLTSSKNPSVVNQVVTFTATITSTVTPTGMVKFYSGTTLIGSGNLVGGVISVPYTFTTQGTYAITAVYSGDSNTGAATSGILSQLVLNIATITLTSSINPIFINNTTILTATAASTGLTPTGLVTFYDGAAPLGNATLVNGVAMLSVSFPAGGLHSLTAVYYGDPITAPASSAPYTQTAADFSVATATGMPSTASILQGGTATYSLVLTPIITTTLPAGVVFTLTGLPKGATYTYTPPSVAAGAGTTPFILTINTPVITTQLRGQPIPTSRHSAPIAAAFLLLPLVAFARRRKLSKRFGSLLMLLLIGVGIASLTGCATDPNSGYYGVVAKTYNLTVTGTSGQLTRTTGLTLTIQ